MAGAFAGATASAMDSAAAAAATADGDQGFLDQTLYDSVRHPLALANAAGSSNVIATAVAAVAAGVDPQLQQQLQASGQLPTVSTQMGPDSQTGRPTGAGHQQSGGATTTTTSHAPLNATNTMKQAPGVGAASSPTTAAPSPRKATGPTSSASVVARKTEVIRATELLLNALNQGDYDTYTRLCDPHMTSFEPENLGHLIDNMEYRRLCLDQARQLQFHHLYQQQIIGHSQSSQQVATAAAAAAAAAASAAAIAAVSGPGNNNSKQQLSAQQLQQVAQAAALGAANAAMANMSLENSQVVPANSSAAASTQAGAQSAAVAGASRGALQASGGAIVSQQAAQQPANCASFMRQYSIMVNPAVYLLGDEAASIAYTKLSQTINLATGQMNSEQSEETRVWHKRDGNKWLCVHFHRSQAAHSNDRLLGSQFDSPPGGGGPQTSVSLIRSMFNQQLLASLHQLQPQLQAASVPLISLNHSSAGSGGGHQTNSQNQSAPNNSSR